jgi:predicted permease
MSKEWSSIEVSIDGIVNSIVMVLSGVIITRLNVFFPQILTKEAAGVLSNVIMNLFLPCLIFYSMITGLDTSQLNSLFVILFYSICKNYTVHAILGCFIGWVFARVSRANEDQTKLMTVCVGFGDVTDIPLTLTNVLGSSVFFKNEENFTKNTITYVLLYNVFIIILKWSFGYL